MKIAVIKEVIQKSLDSSTTFPQVVGRLLEIGIDSYHVDLIRGENRYYATNDESHLEHVPLPHAKAASEFSAADVRLAVQTIQQGRLTYREFLDKILAAGCVYYIACLTGKKVIYLGRNGDSHVEHFPNSQK